MLAPTTEMFKSIERNNIILQHPSSNSKLHLSRGSDEELYQNSESRRSVEIARVNKEMDEITQMQKDTPKN